MVAPNVTLVPHGPNNKLPRNCDRVGAERLGAVSLPLQGHLEILDEISRRDHLDYAHSVAPADGDDEDSISSQEGVEGEDSVSEEEPNGEIDGESNQEGSDSENNYN